MENEQESDSEHTDTPEKPFNDDNVQENDLSIEVINENLKSDSEVKSFESNIMTSDISEIDKQLDKVGAMIFKEEETYAELEKKVNEMQEKPYDIEETTAAFVGGVKKKSAISSAISPDIIEHEEDENKSTENWMASLVPEMKSVLEPSEIISEEKISMPDEDKIAEAKKIAESEILLTADNPMLEKFQSVLKQHLLRQIAKLKNSILEIGGDHKKKETSLKVESDLAYKEQQTIVRQRETLENYRNTIEKVAQQRKTLEEQMQTQRENYDEMRKTYEKTKSEVEHCQGESEMLDDLVKKMSEHDKQQEKEIALSKQKQSFNLKDKERLSKEKQAQDMLLWRMTKNILDKRRETEDRIRRTKSKTKECNVLSERLLSASVDRAELLLINELLTKELQKAFHYIKARDTALLTVKKELQEAETNWKKLVMSLNWYRKHLRLLMAENETLSHQKRKNGDEVQFLNDKLEVLKEERFRAMEELNSFDDMLKGADRDFEHAEQLSEALKADEEHILKQISIACGEKMRLEKAYMEKLVYRDTAGKMVNHVNDLILKMVEEHKNKEFKMYKLENQLAREMVELEILKGSLKETELELENVKMNFNVIDNNYTKLESSFKKLTDKEFEFKNSVIGKKKHLENLETSWANKTYLDSPLVIKKRKLSEGIAKLEESIEEKEEIWLEFQEGCLRASNKRQKQLERINFLRKQAIMMEGTLERLTKNLNELKREFHQVLNSLENHRRNICALQAAELKQGKMRQKAEENTKELEETFINLLKNLEEESMALQQEVWELEEENEKKVQTIDTLQRELLEWSKKYSMAIDLKKEIEEEKQRGGEIAAMKQEIHRMEIRFSNLRKVEERLTNDLDLCLSRRDSIIDSAEAREKRAKTSGITIRAQAWRRMEDTKAKLRSLTRELKELRKEKLLCIEQRRFLTGEAEFWKKSVSHLSYSLEQLEHQIKEGQIHCHRTLEMTVMRQRKVKLLEELKSGRYRVIGKTEDNLVAKEESALKIQNTLLRIIYKLKEDFPLLGLQLKQIENTISYKLDPEEIENK
ncbi:coiled-coil domain-containing protein 40 isoform X1 [Halyomorpha halys]|uniref:coiled-coil domain-containing protein 40 isoform X1 n=2 Tax=Halyomorpha halys TaxID=286706 RepID=UPI0006D4FBCC|nr:coiled-coil domain-containing protein 40 isoform X1 [Halyomorpha halys]XP_014288578.1 coiled-coil domain-containing protein 40 isoform X1 [Halyomorpha halys]